MPRGPEGEECPAEVIGGFKDADVIDLNAWQAARRKNAPRKDARRKEARRKGGRGADQGE